MELSACVEPSAASATAAAQRLRCFWKFSRMRRAEASLPMTRPQPRHRRRHFGPARPSAQHSQIRVVAGSLGHCQVLAVLGSKGFKPGGVAACGGPAAVRSCPRHELWLLKAEAAEASIHDHQVLLPCGPKRQLSQAMGQDHCYQFQRYVTTRY
jgi:hypothetical protein